MLDLVVPLRCKSYAEVDEVDEDGAAAQLGVRPSWCHSARPGLGGLLESVVLGLASEAGSQHFFWNAKGHAIAKGNPSSGLCQYETHVALH